MSTMMPPKYVCGLVLCSAILFAVTAHAAARPAKAVTTSITGEAEFQTQGKEWKRLFRGLALTEGASARTGEKSMIDMFLSTQGQIRLTQTTIIRFDQLREETTTLPERGKKPTAVTSIELDRGKILVRATAPTEQSSFVVTTRSCLSEVRGFGAYSVSLLNNRACVRVMDQTVTVLIRGRADPVILQAGQQLCVECDPRTNQARDVNAQPTTIAEPDPDWTPTWTPPSGGPTTTLEAPPVYEISPSKP